MHNHGESLLKTLAAVGGSYLFSLKYHVPNTSLSALITDYRDYLDPRDGTAATYLFLVSIDALVESMPLHIIS